MDRERAVIGLPITCSQCTHPAAAAAARASTSATGVRSISSDETYCSLTRCLIVMTVSVLAILYCIIFPYTVISLYPNIPSHPEFKVAAADEAAELRLGVLVSNPNCCRFLSFTNVTLAAAGVPFGGGIVLQHPPFQVAGNQTAMMWFRLQNATNSSSAGGAPLASVELKATIRPGGGVKWPATSGEISMTTRCDPITITYNIDDEVTESRGCKRRSRDQWDKDGRQFTRVSIIGVVFLAVAFVVAIYGCVFLLIRRP